MKKINVCIAALIVALFSAPAIATVYTYKFTMDGSQEVPPVVTGATGTCTVTLDDVANQVSASCTYSGLSSNANNAHIHAGAVGVSGAPIVTLAFTAATSGTATATNAAISGANVSAMIAGNTYINIHSVNHGTGEIRGQVAGLIPATSTWGLLALAILVISAATLVLRPRRVTAIAN